MSVRPGQAKGAYTGLNAADLPIPVENFAAITMTAAGFSGTAPTTTVSFARVGRLVCIGIAPFSGTSNSTGMTLVGPIPSWALPPTASIIFPYMRGANSSSGMGISGYLSPALPNTIVFGRVGGNTAFSSSGIKGVGDPDMDWFLPQFSTYIVP